MGKSVSNFILEIKKSEVKNRLNMETDAAKKFGNELNLLFHGVSEEILSNCKAHWIEKYNETIKILDVEQKSILMKKNQHDIKKIKNLYDLRITKLALKELIEKCNQLENSEEI